MFQNIIESLLGDWGPEFLDFVYKHQLIISIFVVIVGIFMIIRKRRKQAQKERNK